MAYKGFVGSGTVGHFATTTALQNQYPADTYAGRMATVEGPDATAIHYFSNGTSWLPNAQLVTDSSGITAAVRCALQLTSTGAVFQCPGNPSTPTSWIAMSKSVANEPNVTYPSVNHGGVRMTPPARLTAGSTVFQYVIAVEVAATTGACVLDVSNPQLNVLT